MAAPTNTRFTGDIVSGSLTNQGSVVLHKVVTLTETARRAQVILPNTARITDARTVVRTAVSGAIAGVAILVGTSADQAKFYTTAGVSALGVYRNFAAVSGNSWANVGNTDGTDAYLTVESTAAGTGSWVVDHIIEYVR